VVGLLQPGEGLVAVLPPSLLTVGSGAEDLTARRGRSRPAESHVRARTRQVFGPPERRRLSGAMARSRTKVSTIHGASNENSTPRRIR
jgi:hypothetical protein